MNMLQKKNIFDFKPKCDTLTFRKNLNEAIFDNYESNIN